VCSRVGKLRARKRPEATAGWLHALGKGQHGLKTRSGSGEFDLSDPVRGFVNTVRRVIFSPRDFFRGMPRSGSFLNPLIFAAVCALIGALMSGVFQEVAHLLPGMQIFSVNTGFVLSGALLLELVEDAGSDQDGATLVADRVEISKDPDSFCACYTLDTANFR
jgi:hypothetical protein